MIDMGQLDPLLNKSHKKSIVSAEMSLSEGKKSEILSRMCGKI